MGGALDIAVRDERGVVIAAVTGEIDISTVAQLRERLYELAIGYAQPSGTDRVFDLYCGIGTIGLLMAPRAAEVWGLELVEEAIADAIAGARRNEIDNAHFFAGDVRLEVAAERARAAAGGARAGRPGARARPSPRA